MGDTDCTNSSAIDVSAIDWSRLTPEQRTQLECRIIREAHAARARALRDLLRKPLRLVRSAASGLGALWRAGVRALERRRAARELGALDDRMLRDIGLNRSQITEAVRGRGPLRG